MSMNNNYSNNSHNNNSHNDNNNLQFTEEMFQNYNKILQQQTNSILNNKINSHNNNHNQNNQSNKSHESFTNSQVNDQNYSNLEQLFALKAPQPPAMSHTFIPSTTTQPVQRTPNTYLQNYLPPPLPNTKAMSYPPTNQTVAQNPVPAPAANNNNPLAALPPHLYEQFKQFLMVQSSAQPAPVNQFNQQQQQQQQQLLGGYNTNTPSTTLPQTLSQTLPQLNTNPYTQTPNLLAGMLGLPSNDINSLPNNPSAVAVSSILQQQLMLQQLMQLQLQQLQTPNQANPFPNMMSPPMNNNNNPFLALPSFNNNALPTQNIPTIPSFPLNTPNVPLSAPLPPPSAPKSNPYHAPNPPPAQATPVQGTTTGRPNNSHPSISHLSYEDVMGTRGQGNPPHSVRPEHTKAKPSSSSLLSPHQDFTLQDISAMIESATKNIRENAHLIATNMVCRVNGIKLDRLHQLASATLKDLNDHHATTNATTTTTTTNSGRMILGDGSGGLPLTIPSSTSFILKKKNVNEIEEDISGEDDQNNYNKKKRKIEGNHDEMNLTNNISNDNHSSSSIEIKIKKRKKKLPPLYDENGNIIPRKRGRPRKDNMNSSSNNNHGNNLLSPPDELIDPLPLRSFPNNELQKRAESIVNEIVAGLMSKNSNNNNSSSSNTATSAIERGSIEGIIKTNDMDVLKNGIAMMNSMHKSDDVDSFDDDDDDEEEDDEEEEEEEFEEDDEDDDIISQKDDGGDSQKKVSFNNTVGHIPIQIVQNSTIITESDQPPKDVIELTEEVIKNEEAKKEAVTPLKTINRKEEMEEEDGEELLSEASEEEEEEVRPSSQKKREINTTKDPKSNKRLDSRSKVVKKQEQEKVRRTSRSSQQDEFSEEVETVKNSSEVEQEIIEEEEVNTMRRNTRSQKAIATSSTQSRPTRR